MTAVRDVAAPLPALPLAEAHGSANAFRRAAWLVAGFWWLSTGLIFALQRSDATRLAAMLLFSAAAAAAIAVVIRTRADRSPRSVGLAFLAGGTLWAWQTNALFGGWIVGPAGVAATAPGPSPALALEAIHATLYSEVTGLALIALVAILVRGAPNRMALAAMAVLWGSQQLAKLNIFLGVPNPGTRFLPDDLVFLSAFFGPERPSLLLWLSAAVLAVPAIRFGRRAMAGAPDRRFGAAILALLFGLAAVEHVVLGVPLDLPLWDLFLRLRGG